MLMSFPDLVETYSMSVRSVLHCGAHLAEEAPLYASLDVERVLWIEANAGVSDQIFRVLDEYPNQDVFWALLHESDGDQFDFHVTNYDGMSSSILEFGTHPEFSPDTVFTGTIPMRSRSIDSICADLGGFTANFLNMDLQGVEGPVLRGATEFLKGVDYVMSEVNCEEVYVGCTRVEELDKILSDFERVETYWVGDQGWGDALWIRRA